jgi:hypothetical protein
VDRAAPDQALGGAVGVVVRNVDPQDLRQVTATNDQQPIQALGAHRRNPALCVRVRVGCLHRRQQHLGGRRTEHVVEPATELRVTIADEEAHPASSFPEHQWQVAGLLGDPGGVGVGGHPGQVDPAGVQFDEEQHLQSP